MTQQIINNGTAEDDNTGDHNRVAWDKTNQNFTELYAVTYQPLDGVTDGSNAAAGMVGEYLETAASGFINCTPNVSVTVHSIALPAGDWDVWGGFMSQGGMTAYAGCQWAIGPVAGGFPGIPGKHNFGVSGGSGFIHAVIGVQRISLAAATTYYFVFNTDASGASINAILSARRRR